MSTLGHSGQGGQGGHGGHGGHSGQGAPGHHGNHGHGHHGHSGGGNAIGGNGIQQTWNSIIQETRFSGEMFRNPLVPLMIYGMVFLSIMLIICLADNNLLDFAVQQHNEAQKKRMQEMAAAQMKAEETAAARRGNETGEQEAPDKQVSDQQVLEQQAVSQPGFDQQLSSVNEFLPRQPANAPIPESGISPSTGAGAAQTGYLQQSLIQQNSFLDGQPRTFNAQPAYGSYGATNSSSAYFMPPPQAPGQHGFTGAAGQMGGASGFSQGGYHAAGHLRSGAYLQGGFKTGADGVSQVPMNRMVVNR